jgi:hypothetical protein
MCKQFVERLGEMDIKTLRDKDQDLNKFSFFDGSINNSISK